jgi:predicted nucleic acid-binding protein
VIFVGTSFWIAWLRADDCRHDEATALMEAHGNDPLVTSNHVRGEAWTFLRRRYEHRAAVAFLDLLARSERLRLAFVSEELEAEALRWLRRHDEREYSFVDATSFALMRSLRIKRALAFAGDFGAAGFIELRIA